MYIISGSNISFQYKNNQPVLTNIHFDIESGKFTAILGKNGCGKSTLIKLIMALFPLSDGKIFFNGNDINTKEGLYQLRRHCGIVFQNPDNQFVSPIIEDDIRFGLENHGIPESEHNQRIAKALETVSLRGFEKRSTSTLSGGQKQRAAAAGILALESDVLIFDEATSMLDPDGRAEMIQCINKLRNENRTIIMITQNIEECINADTIFLMSDHQIVAKGSSSEILTNIKLLEKTGITPPFPVRVFFDLKSHGIDLDHCPLTYEDLSEELCSLK